jgi:hypothetical protein
MFVFYPLSFLYLQSPPVRSGGQELEKALYKLHLLKGPDIDGSHFNFQNITLVSKFISVKELTGT